MQALLATAKAADTAAEEARGMVLKEELRGKRRLLRKLGHTDRDFSVLLPKGQASLLKGYKSEAFCRPSDSQALKSGMPSSAASIALDGECLRAM